MGEGPQGRSPTPAGSNGEERGPPFVLHWCGRPDRPSRLVGHPCPTPAAACNTTATAGYPPHCSRVALLLLPSKPRLLADARWRAAATTLLVGFVFAAYGAYPPPDPNEPHYLTKARHFWDPQWCAGDLFLESRAAHALFYAVWGSPARWVPLAMLAWIGRACTWLLLAYGWQRLGGVLGVRGAWAALGAVLFVELQERCQLAGEWVIGGLEAKGFAYALVLLALAEFVRGRLGWAAAWAGAATAWHPLVGGWTGLAMCWSWCSVWPRPRVRRAWPGLVAGGLLALIGVMPALCMNRGVSPDVAARAIDIYVLWRLRHHLWPAAFPLEGLLRFGLLLAGWGAMLAAVAWGGRWHRFWSVCKGAVLIMVVGLALGLAALAVPGQIISLLRFYWFRTSDVMVPMAVALGVARLARRAWGVTKWRVPVGGLVLAAAVSALLAAEQRLTSPSPRADKPGKVTDWQDWRAACLYAARHTPADARFLTPRLAQTFKWYAGRSETATWKDTPQDAKAIVEWWGRLRDIYGVDPGWPGWFWCESLAEVSPSRLSELGVRYGAEYLLVESEPVLDLPCLYRNRSYAIYRLK